MAVLLVSWRGRFYPIVDTETLLLIEGKRCAWFGYLVTDGSISAASGLRTRISTGYAGLDEALQGGVYVGSAVLLGAPASNEVPSLVRKFLTTSDETSLLICRSQSSADAVRQPEYDKLHCMICSDRPIPPSKNTVLGKGIDNLTELNFQISETLNSVQPKRIVLEILSDVLLRHKALQTRKWLNELLEKLRSKNITTLAVINPYMHASEEAQAIVDLFDGYLEIIEKDVEGQSRKLLCIRWMHGVAGAGKELPLLDLTQEEPEAVQSPAIVAGSFKQPRWLTSLVGRKEELSKLQTTFQNVLASRASVVGLQGEAGSGKTRIMQELAVYAQSKGAVVLFGSASEGGLPYAPWIDVMRQYVAVAPAELLRRMLSSYASEIVKLVPDIAAKLGTIPPSKPLGDQQDKIRLFEAATQFFISLLKKAPLLLLFDDMHSTDASSLELLEYFIRSTSNLRQLTICSYRGESVQSDSPLYQTLMKFNKQRLLETIPVNNLSKEETTELIKQTFGEHTISPEFADLIYHRTGGNPFFVEEVLRSLVDEGTLYRTEKGWERKPIQEIVLPKSVKSALKSRLVNLDPEAMSMLQYAAVIGPDFDFEVLKETTQMREEVVLEKLETAINQGLVAEIPNDPSRLRFTDSRIRDLLLEDLIQLKRRRYHLKIAETMEKVYAKSPEAHAEVIALHFAEGGDRERTIKYSVVAGDRNSGVHAHEQAIRNYKLAFDTIEIEEGKDEEKAAILEKLAGCYDFASQFQNAVQSYEQALSTFEKLSDLRSCARISPKLANEVYRVKGPREALLLLRETLKFVEGTPESFEAAAIYSTMSNFYALMDEYEEANVWTKRALEAGEKSENITAVANALQNMGYPLADAGRIDEALPILEKSLQVAIQHGAFKEAAINLINLTFYTYQRDLSKARGFATRLLDLSVHENQLFAQATGLCMLSILDWLGGDWLMAMDETTKAFEIQERLGFAFSTFNAEAWRGLLHLGLGDLEQAEKYLQLALARQSPTIAGRVETNLGLGALRLEQDREEEAKAHFEACVEAFKVAEFSTLPLLNIETLLHLTSIYARHGQLEEARKMCEWVRRLADTLKSDAGLAMASQAKARLLQVMGELKGAQEAYTESLSYWEKAGWPYYRVKTLVDYAEVVVKASPEQSRNRLEQAVEIFRKLGAKRDLEKAEARLSAHS